MAYALEQNVLLPSDPCGEAVSLLFRFFVVFFLSSAIKAEAPMPRVLQLVCFKSFLFRGCLVDTLTPTSCLVLRIKENLWPVSAQL